MEALTAAHRTLPFGTLLHVTDLETGKAVDVRVNDRGPFVADRLIDLSHAAALRVAMPAVARVRLQVLSKPKTRGLEVYAVQVAALHDRSEAFVLMRVMQRRFGDATITFRDLDQTWSVLVGALPTLEAATLLQAQIGQPSGATFVVLLDPLP